MKTHRLGSIAILLLILLTITTAVSLVAAPPGPTADDFFDRNTVEEIRLTVNTRDWTELKEHYRENRYYLADLRWRDQVVRNVGIRSRGAGSRNAEKPGLRVDMDRYSSSQEFLGLKSFVLDNLTQDPSMLKERVVMRFYNEMGIAAPRVVNVRLFVNNEYIGLYGLVESIDKRFLKNHFGENDGYLFEFHYTDRYGFEYLGSELERYAEFFEPKTHESDSMAALYHPLREMIWTISESPDSMFPSAITQYLDLRTFLTYLAVETFVADTDGLLGHWGMNNFYLYRFEGNSRSQLIPWDKDTAFWGSDQDIRANVDTNVLVRRALQERAFESEYLDALRRCVDLSLRPAERNGEDEGDDSRKNVEAQTGWFEREIDFVYQQIRPYALQDEKKPYSNERFEDEVVKARAFSQSRPHYVQREAEKPR